MQAVILAAGMGKRLGELTKNNTKCMIKVNGITLIERVLTQLSSLPLTRIIIVIGYKGEELRAFLGNTYNGLAMLIAAWSTNLSLSGMIVRILGMEVYNSVE